MITLHYINNHILVFKAEDWNTLRTKYRIIGELLGNTGKNEDLPVALTAEQTNMLIKKGVVKVVTSEYTSTDEVKEIYNKHLEKLYEEEKIILKEDRKQEISEKVDEIMEGKKRKGETNLSSENILNEEMAKLPELKKENMITVTSMEHPDYMKGAVIELPNSTILTNSTRTRCTVYEDLWEKGYYVTNGRKFGGDYLVYLGDPIAFHALYIVKCIEDLEQKMTVTELVMYGRLGNSVKKKFIFAGLAPDNTVKYISINWMES